MTTPIDSSAAHLPLNPEMSKNISQAPVKGPVGSQDDQWLNIIGSLFPNVPKDQLEQYVKPLQNALCSGIQEEINRANRLSEKRRAELLEELNRDS